MRDIIEIVQDYGKCPECQELKDISYHFKGTHYCKECAERVAEPWNAAVQEAFDIGYL